MDDLTKRVLKGLKSAMLAEKEGQHFYLMAASSTTNEKGRRIFAQLAEDEVNHFNTLQAQYASFAKTGKMDPNVKFASSPALSGSHPIFAEEIKNRIGNAHYEMTALSIGIQLETSAVNFYTKESEAIKDPDLKKFYLDLAEWEKVHLANLMSQQAELKEDYWDKGGFSPF